MPGFELFVNVLHEPNCLEREKQKSIRTKIKEATIYNPSVTKTDNTIFLKIGFVNTSDIPNVLPWVFLTVSATPSIPLMASRYAAIYNPQIKVIITPVITSFEHVPSYKL